MALNYLIPPAQQQATAETLRRLHLESEKRDAPRKRARRWLDHYRNLSEDQFLAEVQRVLEIAEAHGYVNEPGDRRKPFQPW